MGQYPDLVRALQAQRSLFKAECVRLDFKSQTMWVWNGPGPLVTVTPGGGGNTTWDGLGKLGSIGDIDRSLVPGGGGPSLMLSGVDPTNIATALASVDEVKGRPCRIFEQYFDNETLALVDQPVAIYAGYMDRMLISDDGPNSSTVTVKLVTLLYRRRRPAFARLSDIDQRSLYPTPTPDKGASQIPSLVSASPSWPNYS